jgi:tetratricopeptide (TPR) repeat protein
MPIKLGPSPLAAAILALGAFAAVGAALGGKAAPRHVMAAESLAGLYPSAEAQAAETEKAIAFYTVRLEADPRSASDQANLAGLYLQRSRETGEFGDVLRAEELARASLKLRSRSNPKAFRQLAASLLAQHRFTEAMTIARELVRIWPEDPAHRALLGELQMEVGDYAAAEVTFGTIRQHADNLAVAPRLARWAELHGRPDEARAIFAGSLRQALYRTDFTGEQMAWYYLRLGDVELRAGQVDAAESAFRSGLVIAPGDYRLLSALARLELARGRYEKAAELGEEATATVLDPATLGTVSEAYALLGDRERAGEYAGAMKVAVQGQAAGFHREWGLFLLDHGGDVAMVTERARAELAERRDVYGHDLMAWALFRSGRPAEARAQMAQALRLGTRDPLLFYHAGMIERAAGDDEAARRHLRRALELNPRFHPRHAATARAVLDSIPGGGRLRLPW